MLADTIKRTFASSTPATSEGQQELTQAFNKYIEGDIDLIKAQEHKEAEA